MWALAICRAVAPPIDSIQLASRPTNGSHKSAPSTLKSVWPAAARIASRGLPSAASTAVTAVPTLAPSTRAMPASRVMKPCWASTITMPVVADDDWTRAVNTAPTASPRSGFSIRAITSMKVSDVRSGAMASPMSDIPKNTRPSPRTAAPCAWRSWRLAKNVTPKPAATATRA